jgi:hypothetical protein
MELALYVLRTKLLPTVPARHLHWRAVLTQTHLFYYSEPTLFCRFLYHESLEFRWLHLTFELDRMLLAELSERVSGIPLQLP